MLFSLRARTFRTNCSGWYGIDITSQGTATVSDLEATDKLQLRVISGNEQSILTEWLTRNQQRFPWIYVPAEMQTGARCRHWYPCLFDGQKLIGYVKLARDAVYIHDFEQEVSLLPRVALVYDVFVHPEYRGRQLAQCLVRYSVTFLKQRGFEKLLCHIEDWNVASIRTFTRSGFVRLATIRYLRMGLLKRLIVNGTWYRVKYITRWTAAVEI